MYKRQPSICCSTVNGDVCCSSGNGCGQKKRRSDCRCYHKGSCCSQENCQAIASLIYKSMTSCYATDRRSCIHKLGDRYDCVCHPEIMSALVHALNDSDERVRAKAADEIGDQIRRNRCCCSQSVVCALTRALADCDKHVRRQAEEALELCGYEIVDGCCSNGGAFAGCCQAVSYTHLTLPTICSV